MLRPMILLTIGAAIPYLHASLAHLKSNVPIIAALGAAAVCCLYTLSRLTNPPKNRLKVKRWVWVGCHHVFFGRVHRNRTTKKTSEGERRLVSSISSSVNQWFKQTTITTAPAMIIKSLFSLFSLTFSISPFEPWHCCCRVRGLYVEGQYCGDNLNFFMRK